MTAQAFAIWSAAAISELLRLELEQAAAKSKLLVRR